MDLIKVKASAVSKGDAAEFDPMTVYAVIVALVRLVVACNSLWKVRHPGLFGRLRLRRIVNHYCPQLNATHKDKLFEMLLSVGRDTTDEEVRQMHSEIISSNYPAQEVVL